MSTVTSINKATAKEIGAAVESALASVAEQFGLEVSVRGGTFDAGSFKPKVEFTTANAAEEDFVTYASLYGLDACHWGAEFTSKGKRFRISGLAHRSRTYPILATEIATGKQYKFTSEGIARALKAAV